MRTTHTLLATILIASMVMWALASGQSSPRRRPPVLTNDDLGSAREAVRLPPEPDVQPAERPKPEAIRGPISWHRDLRRAFEAADADGKLVIVDVYTDWCGWCKKMDKTIYSSPTVAALSSQQAFVKVNAEDGGQGQNFAEQMGVTSYPTTIILDGQGRVLNFVRGYIASPQAFVKLVQEAQATRAR
ncbi:MAG: thioredoxin family protein [Blastocatellia bacterium]